MSIRSRGERRFLVLGLAALAGCAEIPTQPAPAPFSAPRPSAHEERVRQAIAKHQRLAREYRQAGDLASAEVQLQLVTLLAPGDAAARQELAAMRSETARRAQENLSAGNAALRAGDMDKAADAMLRALALDPDNEEAAKELREIEKRRAARIQAARAGKAGGTNGAAIAAAPAAAPTTNGHPRPVAPRTAAPAVAQTAAPAVTAEGYSYEVPLEMFKAGDSVGGLRDLHRYVDANPGDRAARMKIGAAVYDRAIELEAQGAREQAFSLYEQAVALRGEPGLGWNLRIQSLRKSLSEEYYEKGVQIARSNPGQAIKDWEASLRFDPQNAKTAARLKEAKSAQERAAGKS
jgi:tetratricopeptide (TPR) repeat protein